MAHYRILIADDHQLIIDGIKSMLDGEQDYKIVWEATNGQQALDKINQNPDEIDLLLTDVSMPILSGTELCKIVKKSFPHIKVLILSMYNNSAIIREALSAESDGYILKTTGQEELLLALHKIRFDGTYYTESIFPILYQQKIKEDAVRLNLSNLSTREIEVLQLIVQENTSEEIAEKLFISKKTVDNHRQNLLTKTNCKSTIGLVKFALANGMK